jgi:hypothetical protein
MIFYDLNGREHRKEVNYRKHEKVEARSSALSEALYAKIEELLPGYGILCEFPCVGIRPTLFLDFVILGGVRFAFEADGRQHKEFIPHFHGTRANFARQKINDLNKERWCIENNIKLIRVAEMSDVENLAELINERQ